jgi:thiol-disulfide isomerase/thioredoxin
MRISFVHICLILLTMVQMQAQDIRMFGNSRFRELLALTDNELIDKNRNIYQRISQEVAGSDTIIRVRSSLKVKDTLTFILSKNLIGRYLLGNLNYFPERLYEQSLNIFEVKREILTKLGGIWYTSADNFQLDFKQKILKIGSEKHGIEWVLSDRNENNIYIYYRRLNELKVFHIQLVENSELYIQIVNGFEKITYRRDLKLPNVVSLIYEDLPIKIIGKWTPYNISDSNLVLTVDYHYSSGFGKTKIEKISKEFAGHFLINLTNKHLVKFWITPEGELVVDHYGKRSKYYKNTKAPISVKTGKIPPKYKGIYTDKSGKILAVLGNNQVGYKDKKWEIVKVDSNAKGIRIVISKSDSSSFLDSNLTVKRIVAERKDTIAISSNGRGINFSGSQNLEMKYQAILKSDPKIPEPNDGFCNVEFMSLRNEDATVELQIVDYTYPNAIKYMDIKKGESIPIVRSNFAKVLSAYDQKLVFLHPKEDVLVIEDLDGRIHVSSPSFSLISGLNEHIYNPYTKDTSSFFSKWSNMHNVLEKSKSFWATQPSTENQLSFSLGTTLDYIYLQDKNDYSIDRLKFFKSLKCLRIKDLERFDSMMIDLLSYSYSKLGGMGSYIYDNLDQNSLGFDVISKKFGVKLNRDSLTQYNVNLSKIENVNKEDKSLIDSAMQVVLKYSEMRNNILTQITYQSQELLERVARLTKEGTNNEKDKEFEVMVPEIYEAHLRSKYAVNDVDVEKGENILLFKTYKNAENINLTNVALYIAMKANQLRDIDALKMIDSYLEGIKAPRMASKIVQDYFSKFDEGQVKVKKYEIVDLEGMSAQEILMDILKVGAGKVIAIDVWATWCAPCLKVIKNSKETHEYFQDKPLQFVYICSDGDKEKGSALSIIDQFDIQGRHYLLSKAQEKDFVKMVDLKAYPHYIIYDSTGKEFKMPERLLGANKFVEFREMINPLLSKGR